MTSAAHDDGVPIGSLPDRVRRLVVDAAADVLGELPEADVSLPLRRVRSFAPARRARAGAIPLAAALERDAPFRQQVAAAWRRANPELADALESAVLSPEIDPVIAAAGTYLIRPEGWETVVAHWLRMLTEGEEDARRAEWDASVRSGLEAARADTQRWREVAEAAEASVVHLKAEVSRLERDVRRLRADADRARAEARKAAAVAAAEEARSAAAMIEHQVAIRQAEQRVSEALDQVATARRIAREGRDATNVRARLLLDTVVEAAGGLRRELALPPVDQLPADQVAASLSGGAGRDDREAAVTAARALPADDPAVLDGLLTLPRAHLVVDGYNVTKSGYGSLPLVDQRRRLVDGLTALAARTNAEITCCFDGADVEARGASKSRGVRVLFSDPGITADELIRQLVRAEPTGRVVVVVSSDGEVVSGVVAAGARAAPSSALLRLLGRS